MDTLKLHWLAGLLEGEGSFCRPTPSSNGRPIVSLQMTDEDVVAKVAVMFGLRYHRQERPPNKPVFTLHVRGTKAIRLMQDLRPLMSERRQGQIDAALSAVNMPGRFKKYPDDTVRRVVQQYREGVTPSAIAQAEGIPIRAVRSFVYGQRRTDA